MHESLKTVIGQFSSSGGQVQTRATNVRAVEPATDLPGAEHGYLYILVEVTGSGGGHAAIYRQMLSAAQTAFYEASGNISASLTRAVRNAHLALVQANKALPDANWRAGISCVAFQDGELTIAQAGPGLVVVSHPKTVDQFRAASEPAVVPLGGPDRPDADQFRTTAEAKTILLLAPNDWLNYVAPEALAAVAFAESVPLALEYLSQLAGKADLSALVIGFEESSAPDAAVAVSPAAPAEAAAPSSDTGTKAGIFAFGRPHTKEPAAPEVAKVEPAAVVAAAAATAAIAPVAPTAATVSTASAASTAATTPALEAGPAKPKAPPAEQASKPKPPPAAKRPQRQEAEGEESPGRSPWPWLVAVIVVPLLIAGVVLAMLYTRTNSTGAKFDETLSGAESALSQVQDLDEDTARLRLSSARDYLDQARTMRPDDPALAKLQTQYDQQFNRINRVTPLYGIVPLWEFKDAGHQPSRTVVNGDSLYVLDTGRNEVARLVLSQLKDSVLPAEQSPVLAKGQQVGDVVLSDVADMAWVDASGNQRSRLTLLDSAGTLAGYDVTYGAKTVPIAGRDQWGSPKLIMGYGGNFYVVDSKNNQIWRYRPSDKGYENPPEAYFAQGSRVDLTGVQSIAIDGNVWLLFADGRLVKFFAGEQKPFEIKGLPEPLSAPVAIVASLEDDYLYIADAGNGRIVEIAKDGTFKRQFRPSEGDALRDMKNLYLDETSGAFYILTTDNLYKANLPRPEAAPAAAQPTSPTPTPGK